MGLFLILKLSLILESLQSLIDWAQLDCFIAGTAKNGRQGLKLIRRLRPHIVVTDIKMPDVSGIEIAEFCAQQLPGTKLIVLSAYADFVFAQSAMRAGASNYLLKPLSRNELACAVQKVVSELNTAERSMASRSLAETDFENAKTLATSSLLFNLARYGTSGSWRVDDDWVREKIEAGSVVVMGTFFNLTCSIAPALAIGQTHVHQWLHHAGYNPIFGSADENSFFCAPWTKESTIDDTYYEAAEVDGASSFRKFWSITLPLLKPTTFLVVILGFIDLFKQYGLVLTLTDGGPAGVTKFAVQYIYEEAFQRFELGYASALSMVLMVILAFLTLVQFKLNKGGAVNG